MCKTRTIACKKTLFSLNHQFLCWSPKGPLKVPWRPRTLGPLGHLQGMPPGRRVPAGRRLIWRCNPANIRLGEGVLKTSWRRLEDVFSVTFFCLPRRLEDIIARRFASTSWRRLEDVFKTSWRRLTRCLEEVLGRRIANTSWRRLQDVFKTSWNTKSVTLKTSWKIRNVCWEGTCFSSMMELFSCYLFSQNSFITNFI